MIVALWSKVLQNSSARSENLCGILLDTYNSAFDTSHSAIDEYTCSVCNYTGISVELCSWDTLPNHGDTTCSLEYEFTRRTRHWAWHTLHENPYQERTNDLDRTKRNEYSNLLNNVEQLANELLAKWLHPRDVPKAVQICPLFLPDEMGQYTWTRYGKLEKDCLGRTWLHQYLDSKKEDHLCREIEQRMVPDCFGVYRGFDIDTEDMLGRTPLHIACQKRFSWFANTLISLGADFTKQTVFMMTPLHLAAASGMEDVTYALLQFRTININAQDINGCTPYHYAYKHEHTLIHQRLGRDPRFIRFDECTSSFCKEINIKAAYLSQT
jgi:hypothetical protein